MNPRPHAADPLSERRDRLHQIRDVRVLVVEGRNAQPLQPLDQIALRAVEDDEVGPERDDALEIRIDQGADARSRLDGRRIVIEARDSHDLIARADGEEHLGHRGHQRDDPLRIRAGLIV